MHAREAVLFVDHSLIGECCRSRPMVVNNGVGYFANPEMMEMKFVDYGIPGFFANASW